MAQIRISPMESVSAGFSAAWQAVLSCLHPGVQWWRFVIHEAHRGPASSDEVFSLTYRLGKEICKQTVLGSLHEKHSDSYKHKSQESNPFRQNAVEQLSPFPLNPPSPQT